MTFGLMKASGVRSDLRLQRNALVLATVGSLRMSKLLSLSLLYSLLVHPRLDLLQVVWSGMTSLRAPLNLPMMIPLCLFP
jgi:hypothetical protein